MHRILATLAFSCACALVATPALAQGTYPQRQVTIVVPYSAGGTTDLVGRLVGQAIAPALGQPVVVENRLGGGGVVGWNSVARAAPDGHTLVTLELSYTIAAGLVPNLPYDPKSAFAHIVTAVSMPHLLVIHPSVPAKNFAEFVALARAQPGRLNYGSGGVGTNTHLGSELLKSLTGIYVVHIPYKGGGAAMQDLLGNQVQSQVTALPTALQHVKAGKLRALAVTSETRASVLPDVPSAPEVGQPKFIIKFWVGLSGPAGTPAPVVERLNREVVAAMAQPETKRRIAELGLDIVGNSPAQAQALVGDEMARWAALIKARGIKPE